MQTNQVAERLQELLFLNNMKQADLAEKIDVDPSVISSWVNGRRSIPQKNIEDLAEIFELPIADIAHFGCQIPILGEIRENYYIHSYDPLVTKKTIKCKTVWLPGDCVGYIYVSETPYNWRDQMIFIARIRKGGMVDQQMTHKNSNGRICLLGLTNEYKVSEKMIAIPRKNKDDSWDIYAIGDNRLVIQNVDISYCIPILCQFPNWHLLEFGFHNKLEY